jgi:DNA-binding transcriptional regulator LsrR (DeoR family)
MEESLSERLRMAIGERRQAAVAAEIGITESTLSRVLNRAVDPERIEARTATAILAWLDARGGET